MEKKVIKQYVVLSMGDVAPSSQCAGLRIKSSRFEPWRGHCVVFLGKALNTLTVPLSTQE